MLRTLLLTLVIILESFALEISIDSAKDNFIKYSTIHLQAKEQFTCQKINDDFGVTKEIICAFSKKPLQSPRFIENDFFKVDSFIKNNTFFLQITPKYKIKLFANIFDLTKDDTTFDADVTLANDWIVVGYKKDMPLLKKEKHPDIAINFPFFMQRDKLPYVGSLDIKGNPVYIKKVEDVKDYLRIKKYFDAKKYEAALDLIETVLQKYPNTLFKAELLYYKIKVYNALKDYDNVIANSKIYLREYSGDENIPEVLSLIAKAYSAIGQNTDADYFFDRLFSEHSNSLYTFLGYIYKGEMLEESGGDKEAIKFYKKALYGTKKVDVAVDAAYHLAKLHLDTNSKKAVTYIEKILKIKPEYFVKHFKTSKDMMYALADKGRYKAAADIAKAILDGINPSYDEYEDILKDWGLWLSKTNQKKEALAALNKYLKAFPDGDYVTQVQIVKDSLFFEFSDMNNSAKLKEYNKLIEEYQTDTIGQKALYEKAKLLLQEKKYFDVLAMQTSLEALDRDTFEDVDAIIKDAALGAMEQSLQEKNCKAVLDISKEYKIALSNRWDDGVFMCAMKGGDFQLSKKIATKHLKSTNIEQRKEWLFRYIKIDYATGNYSELIDVAKDLIALIDNKKQSKYKEVFRYLFDAYERLSNTTNMIKTMTTIEKVFGLNYKDLDRYTAMVRVAQEQKDDAMIIKYGTKVMQIENRSDSYPQTPYIEFALYQAYMDRNDFTSALNIIQSLEKRSLTKEQRARQKYLLGTVLNKLWRDEAAKKAYEAALKAAPNSPWADLARSALSL